MVIWPYDENAVDLLGGFLESTDQESAALATYIEYRKANPRDPDAAMFEAFFYVRKRIWAKVPPLLEPCIKGRPHGNVFRQLARSYQELNLLADSRRVLKAFLRVEPNEPAALKNLRRIERMIRGEEPAKTRPAGSIISVPG